MVGAVEAFHDDALHAQVVTPHALDELGVVDPSTQMRLDARHGRVRRSTLGFRTRCAGAGNPWPAST